MVPADAGGGSADQQAAAAGTVTAGVAAHDFSEWAMSVGARAGNARPGVPRPFTGSQASPPAEP